MRGAIEATIARYGRLDVLYNNAGIMMAEDSSVVDTEEWVWDRTLGVNVKGIYLCCKYGIPEMLKAGGGSVINIASFVALVGCSVPQDAYTASKGAVMAFTRSLALSLAPEVRVHCVAPGWIQTAWGTGASEVWQERVRRETPLCRWGKPEDVASAVRWLVSPSAGYFDGQIVRINGGAIR